MLSFALSSSLVLKVLKDAHNAGKNFRVVVVDSRPKFEGMVKIVCSKLITAKRNSAADFLYFIS